MIKIYKQGQWCDSIVKLRRGGRWVDADVGVWRSGQWEFAGEDKELDMKLDKGAYTTWFDDPSTSVMIHYFTSIGEDVVCLYREVGKENWVSVPLYADKPFPFTERRVKWFKLEGLEPGINYETKLEGYKQVHKFETMPSSFNRDIKVSVVSDQANSEERFDAEFPIALDLMHDEDVDLMIVAGDAVHDDGRRSRVWPMFWDHYTEVSNDRGKMIPIITCLGNHDGSSKDENGNFGNLLWVSLDADEGDVLFHYNFFSNLDANAYGAIDIQDYFSFVWLNTNHTRPVKGAQTDWLHGVLSSRPGRTVFPFFHVPPYPGWYGYDGWFTKDVRDTWTPIFTQYDIKVVGAGHEHVHLVTKKVTGDHLDENGVVYFGQGRSPGNTTRGLGVDESAWFVDYLSNEDVGVDFLTFKKNGNIDLKKINLENVVLYEKTI